MSTALSTIPLAILEWLADSPARGLDRSGTYSAAPQRPLRVAARRMNRELYYHHDKGLPADLQQVTDEADRPMDRRIAIFRTR